jgi:hypothetical protein
MSPTERERALAKLAEIDAQLEAERTMDPRGPAGAFSEPIYTTDKPPVITEGKGSLQKAVEFGVPIATTMYGAAKGAEMIAPIASKVPTPMGKAVVLGGGAVAGAALAGAGTEMTLQGVQATMGLPGAPDSIDDAYRRTLAAGMGEGQAELIGRTVIGPVTSAITPFRRAMTPESADVLKTMANRVRAAYEEIGGKPLVEETRRLWNPGRILEPLETELKDSAVYKRLRDAGLDPEVARRVAITGGAVPSRLDTSITSKFWDRVSGSKMVPDEAYEQARGKLLHYATLNDLGSSFADQIPPEQMGKVVTAALSGRFDTLNAVRQTAMNTLDEKLPVGLKLDISDLRKTMGATASVKGPSGTTISGFPKGPASKQPGAKIILGLPDNASFADIQTARATLGNMARDTRQFPDPAARLELRQRIVELDNATRDGLPPRYRSTFRKWTRADDDINKAGFDAHFVEGLLHKEENAYRVAKSIIDNKSVDDFGRLEVALKGTQNGPRILGQVKSAIADQFFKESVSSGGILQPSQLHTALGNNTLGYGKYFLESTLGPEYVRTLHKYIEAMGTVDKAVQKAGSATRVGLTLAGTVAGVTGLMRGVPGTTTGSGFLTAVTVLFSPAVVSKALTNTAASKLLVKTAENVAAGRNPKTTARLAARVLDYIGMTPEAALASITNVPATPRQQAAGMVQQGVVGQGVPTGQPLPMTGGTPLPGT